MQHAEVGENISDILYEASTANNKDQLNPPTTREKYNMEHTFREHLNKCTQI